MVNWFTWLGNRTSDLQPSSTEARRTDHSTINTNQFLASTHHITTIQEKCSEVVVLCRRATGASRRGMAQTRMQWSSQTHDARFHSFKVDTAPLTILNLSASQRAGLPKKLHGAGQNAPRICGWQWVHPGQRPPPRQLNSDAHCASCISYVSHSCNYLLLL